MPTGYLQVQRCFQFKEHISPEFKRWFQVCWDKPQTATPAQEQPTEGDTGAGPAAAGPAGAVSAAGVQPEELVSCSLLRRVHVRQSSGRLFPFQARLLCFLFRPASCLSRRKASLSQCRRMSLKTRQVQPGTSSGCTHSTTTAPSFQMHSAKKSGVSDPSICTCDGLRVAKIEV